MSEARNDLLLISKGFFGRRLTFSSVFKSLEKPEKSDCECLRPDSIAGEASSSL